MKKILDFSLLWFKYKIPLLLGVIFLLGLVAYSNVYSNEFLWDDEFLIQENKLVKDFSAIPKIFTSGSGAGAGRLDDLYRPMQLVAYNLIYQIFGEIPWPFHALNVFLHIASAGLIFFIIRLIFRNDTVAWLTSLFWVVHPIHTEAITYMSGTADPLSLFFGLGSMLVYLYGRKHNRLEYFPISLVFFILALLSKEEAVVLPLLLYLYEIIFNNKQGWKVFLWPTIFFIISLIYVTLRFTLLNFVDGVGLGAESNIYTESLLVRLYTFMASLLVYYGFLLWPVNLHLERSFPVFINPFSWPIIFSCTIFIGLMITAVASVVKKNNYLAFGIFWFFIFFIPVSGIIPVNALILEHWLYWPSIGAMLGVSYLINKIWIVYPDLRKLISLAAIILLVVMINLTLNRNKDWSDPITFYNNILQYNQGTARVHNNLAMAYGSKNQTDLSKSHYLKAIAISDSYPQTHFNLATLYLSLGETNQALSHLYRSIEINPNFFFSYRLIGEIFKQAGDTDQALEYFKKADSIEFY